MEERGEMERMDLREMAERLEAVAETLEQSIERMGERQVALAAEVEERVGRIVATVESAREQELERRLAEAEQRLAELTASAVPQSAGRKTVPTGTASLLAKQGVSVELDGVALQAGAIDAALASLSIEQRIAVKAELLRAGLLG